MPLTRNELPRVALESMNRVHLEEVDLVNELHALIAAKRAGDDVQESLSSKLEEWLAHVRDHFAGEEEKMLACGFTAYPVHKGEHERVLQEILALVDEWRTTSDSGALEDWVEQALPVWIAQHIMTMDTVTAEFILARKGPDA